MCRVALLLLVAVFALHPVVGEVSGKVVEKIVLPQDSAADDTTSVPLTPIVETFVPAGDSTIPFWTFPPGEKEKRLLEKKQKNAVKRATELLPPLPKD